MVPGSAGVFPAQECEMPASAGAADLQGQAQEQARRLRAWICALPSDTWSCLASFVQTYKEVTPNQGAVEGRSVLRR